MHLYTVSRGIKEKVDIAIRDLQAQYFWMNNNGKKTLTQFQVRPIQLWEFVFPREHLECVLATINYRDNEEFYIPKKLSILTKMLKLKRIPKLDYSTIPKKPINNEHVGWHHIGTKEDLVIDGTERL